MEKLTLKFEQKLISLAKKDGIIRFVIGAIIINNQGKILILKRKIDDFFGGIEELPSGKVENEESLFQALNREVKEETNLDVKQVAGYLGHFDYLSKNSNKTRQFNFIINNFIGSVEINPQEHMSYRWIEIDKLEQTGLTKNIINLLTKLPLSIGN